MNWTCVSVHFRFIQTCACSIVQMIVLWLYASNSIGQKKNVTFHFEPVVTSNQRDVLTLKYLHFANETRSAMRWVCVLWVFTQYTISNEIASKLVCVSDQRVCLPTNINNIYTHITHTCEETQTPSLFSNASHTSHLHICLVRATSSGRTGHKHTHTYSHSTSANACGLIPIPYITTLMVCFVRLLIW